jgi:hypothetical protein
MFTPKNDAKKYISAFADINFHYFNCALQNHELLLKCKQKLSLYFFKQKLYHSNDNNSDNLRIDKKIVVKETKIKVRTFKR